MEWRWDTDQNKRQKAEVEVYAGWWEANPILQCSGPQEEFFSGEMEPYLDKDLQELASVG